MRRWGALIAALTLILLGVALDSYLTDSPGAGFCPDDATWLAESADFSAFWAGIESTGAYERLTERVAYPLNPIELAVYRGTGIRPTPLRWRVWMGKALLAARSPAGAGICVRPGLLLRAAGVLRGLTVRADAEGLRRFDKWYYAWRDGYLIVSTSSEYVLASLRSAEVRPREARDAPSLRIQRGTAPRLTVELSAREGLPVEGSLEDEFPAFTPNLNLHPWPGNPLLTLYTPGTEGMGALLGLLEPLGDIALAGLSLREWAGELAGHWGIQAPPAGWKTWQNGVALALLEFEMADSVPVPVLGLALAGDSAAQAPHPLEPALDAMPRIPFEWNSRPGLLAPLWGDQVAICLGLAPGAWLAATQEPWMRRLAHAEWQAAEDAPPPYRLEADWTAWADTLKTLLGHAVESQLLSEVDSRTFESDWAPWLDALRDMGRCELTGAADTGRLRFEGQLAVSQSVRGEPAL